MTDMDVLNEIAALRARVDAMDPKLEILIRAQRASIQQEVLAAIETDPRLGLVYLQVDGNRTQKDIVMSLAGSTARMSQPTVSRKMTILELELALIEPGRQTREGVAYRKTAVDRILRLTPKVEDIVRKKGYFNGEDA